MSSFDAESTVIKPGGGATPRAPLLRVNAGGEGTTKPPPTDKWDLGAPKRGRGDQVPKGFIAATPRLAVDPWDRGTFGGKGVPPLVSAALPLLNLAGRLRGVSEQPDLEALRVKVIQAVKLFEQQGLGGGVPPDRVRAAHYALCATIDDIVLNASWGNYSVWARQSMVSTFHGDVTGGERFFDLLAHLHKDPGTNRDVLLLMYYCLSIGFEGRMRIHKQGHLEIGRIREGLYRTLRGDHERELSPHWRGIDARHRPLSTPLVLWTAVALATLLLLSLYFGLSTALDRRSDQTLTALIEAPPHGLPSVLRVGAKPAVLVSTTDDLRKQLGPEINEGLCSVDDADGGSKINLKNEGLFDVGRADVTPKFGELIDKIGRILHGKAEQIVVVGYTDNTPIHTSRFPSNYYLSVARADAVAQLLRHEIDPLKIRAEGRGAAEPVATNETNEGRERNRRTEIVVLDKKGS